MESVWRSRLDAVAALSMIAAAGFLIYSTYRPGRARPPQRADPPIPSEELSIDLEQARGASTANVAVIEYSDFECPYCRRFAADVLPELNKRYVETGKVLFAFRHLPIEGIHRDARRAAEAATCAARQGQFWGLHDRFFSEPKRMAEPDILAAAAEAGLKADSFRDCLARAGPTSVQASVDEAKRLQVLSTPTFMIGVRRTGDRVRVTKVLRGTHSIGTFVAEFEKLLVNPDGTK